MIDWLHRRETRKLHANSGNTASTQSYTLPMSTGSEQQPANPEFFALIQCLGWIKTGRWLRSVHTLTLPKARAVFFYYSVSRASINKWNLSRQQSAQWAVRPDQCWDCPSSATKSSCNVLAHIKKHAEASKNMLAVTAIENLSPVELALRQSASLAMERTVSAALQVSGDKSVPGSRESSSRCMKKSLMNPTK